MPDAVKGEMGTWYPIPLDREVTFRLKYLDMYPLLCQVSLDSQAAAYAGQLAELERIEYISDPANSNFWLQGAFFAGISIAAWALVYGAIILLGAK